MSAGAGLFLVTFGRREIRMARDLGGWYVCLGLVIKEEEKA